MAAVARMWSPSGKQISAIKVYSKIPFFCDGSVTEYLIV